jgi:hypothetical protein
MSGTKPSFWGGGGMRRAKFSVNLGYGLNRLRVEDGNEEGREKCEGEEKWSKGARASEPFSSSLLN